MYRIMIDSFFPSLANGPKELCHVGLKRRGDGRNDHAELLANAVNLVDGMAQILNGRDVLEHANGDGQIKLLVIVGQSARVTADAMEIRMVDWVAEI